MPTGMMVSNAYSEGSSFFGLRFLDHGYISRAGVEDEQVVLALREGERVGMRADGEHGNDFADVYVVNGDTVRGQSWKRRGGKLSSDTTARTGCEPMSELLRTSLGVVSIMENCRLRSCR